MPLISQTQIKQIYDLAAKEALTVGDAYNTLPLASEALKGFTPGQPTLKSYFVKSGDIINLNGIREYFNTLEFDVDTCKRVGSALEDSLALIELQVWTGSQLTQRWSNQIEEALAAEESKRQNRSTWAHSETFATSIDNIDIENTTATIDTLEGVVHLPRGNQFRNIPNTDIQITLTKTTGVLETPNSNPRFLVDGDLASSYKASFKNETDKIDLNFTFKTLYQLNQLTLEPIGGPLNVEIFYQGSQDPLYSGIIIQRKSVFVPVRENISSLKIVISPVEKSTVPVGLREVIFWTGEYVERGVLQTKALAPTTAYKSIKLDPVQTIPGNTKIDYLVKVGSGSFVPIEPGQWFNVYEESPNGVAIDISSLDSYGALYRYNLSESINSANAKLTVGRNQFEVTVREGTAEHTGDISGFPAKVVDSRLFGKAWVEVTSPVVSYAGSANLYPNAIIDYNEEHSELKNGYRCCGQLNGFENYSAATFLIQNGTTNHPLRPGYRYEFRAKITCKDAVSFDSAVAWFTQGYLSDTSATFKNLGVCFGKYGLYINNERVAGGAIGKTLYADGTYEDGADDGTSYKLAFDEGENEYLLVIEIPTYSTLRNNDYASAWKHLQLVLFPNIFDSNFRERYGIIDVIGSGKFTPKSQVDLLYNSVRSFVNYSLDLGNTSYIMFNTAETLSPDVNLGYLDATAIRPTLTLDYIRSGAGITDNLVFKALLSTVVNKHTPSISGIRYQTR